MNSIWIDVKESSEKQLDSNIKREIVVVGGGIAGFLTAFRLAESGKKVTLIEAETLFSGVTHNTTAHIEALQDLIYSELIATSFENAKLFFDSQQDAISEYEKLVAKYNIDCNFKKVDSCLYAESEDSFLENEFQALKDIGSNAEYLHSPTILGRTVLGAIRLPNQAMFEPIKFLSSLPQNFEIIENNRVLDINFNKRIVYTSNAEIQAGKLVIATNFPIINFPGWYFLKMYKSTSYAISIDKSSDINGMYQSDPENGLTFRNYKDKLIVGGLDHRTGRDDKIGKFDRLYENGKKLTENGDSTHSWSTNDCITFDNLPYIGYYSKKSKDVFVISGFNKWGMANAMIGSMLISDMINGIENKYEKLFSPQRKKHGYLSMFKNMLCTMKNLLIVPILPPFKSSKSLKNDEGAIVFHKGLKKAVYRDAEGNLHICRAFCAHLGCQLNFNCNSKTWDCPCHGSRFDIDGNIICAPTVKDIKP
ncbi:MAG: FAD-dependent oxidoreductase [Clostridia bacterium]|nr:FAD-dependent oxidoreductase [Clostridia bacterium]